MPQYIRINKGSFIKTLEEKIQQMCEELGAPQPFEFLMQVASGTDPRNTSLIYNMVEALENQNGEGCAPDDFDWMELVDIIREKYKGAKVSIGESQAATKLILEYTHSKKRQTDLNGAAEGQQEIESLTKSEIRLFTKKFNHEY